MIERPMAPMLVVRVETDWYAHEAAATQKTSYGLTYSPHYLRKSREQKSQGDDGQGQQ